jgi:hypothetical protein
MKAIKYIPGNFISSSGPGTVINYGSGSDILTSSGSNSTSQKVTVPTVPVPFPQHCIAEQRAEEPKLNCSLEPEPKFLLAAPAPFCLSKT